MKRYKAVASQSIYLRIYFIYDLLPYYLVYDIILSKYIREKAVTVENVVYPTFDLYKYRGIPVEPD